MYEKVKQVKTRVNGQGVLHKRWTGFMCRGCQSPAGGVAMQLFTTAFLPRNQTNPPQHEQTGAGAIQASSDAEALKRSLCE